MSGWNSGWFGVVYYECDCVGYAELAVDVERRSAHLAVTVVWVDMVTMGPVGTRTIEALRVQLDGDTLQSSMYELAEEPSRNFPGEE